MKGDGTKDEGQKQKKGRSPVRVRNLGILHKMPLDEKDKRMISEWIEENKQGRGY